jgi:MFS family permease
MSCDLKIVSAAMLLWGFGEGLFFIFQPIYIQQLGADPILIGTILGINGLVMALAQIPSGYLADKIGRRPLMWFSFIAGFLATFIMAWAPSLGFYVAGLLLYGLTSSVLAPLNTYIQGVRGRWSVGKAVTFVFAMYNLGGILGPVVGGIIGENFNLRSVYFFSAGIFTLSAIIILFAKDQSKDEVPSIAGDGHLLQNKRFVGMLGLSFLVMVAVVLPQPFAANFLQNQQSLSISQIGRLGSIGALGSVLLMLVLGHLRTGYAMLIGEVAVMVYAALLWLGGGIFWYGIGFFFLGGFRLCRAMTVALVQPLVRKHEVGLAFGFVESLNSLAMMAAPILAGVLYNWQPISVFPVSVAVLGMTALLTLRLERKNILISDEINAEPVINNEEIKDA